MNYRNKGIMQRNITNWGYLLIALLISTILVSCTLKNADKGIIVDGHRFVDLQLPSGLLWAETNLGAENDTDFGDQFAWGETQMKEDYSLGTYRYGTEFKKMTKYNSTDRKVTLSPEDDAATVLWGKSCRMPTYEELEELGDTTNCTWKWVEKTTVNNDTIRGYEVKSVRNGNTLFLPASGAHNGKNYYKEGEDALYWTSTHSPRSNGEAFCLYFNLGHYSYYMNDRFIGASVRAVTMSKQ